MQLEKYDTEISSQHTVYEFISVGRHGHIKKIIALTPFSEGSSLYNLGFGDLVEATGDWTDKRISNNGDRRKVLATVAAAVADFLNWHPNAAVYARGNEAMKNHLYRRGIESVFSEIEHQYEIQGYTESNEWEPFKQDRPYEAFLIQHKKQ